MSYLFAKKFHLEFSARNTSEGTTGISYFEVHPTPVEYELNPGFEGPCPDFPRADANDAQWPFTTRFRSFPAAATPELWIVPMWGVRSGSTWTFYRQRHTWTNITKPTANTWYDYEIDIEIIDANTVSVSLSVDGVLKTPTTIQSVSTVDVQATITGTADQPTLLLLTPLASAGLSYYDDPIEYVELYNPVEYNNQAWSATEIYQFADAALVSDSAMTIQGASNVIEVIAGPYFSPSYIADDYVSDGTLASDAAISATTTKLQLAEASLESDFQMATLGGTQKDITLTAFGDSQLSVVVDKVSLATAQLAADFAVAVTADLSSDLSHEFAADFQVAATAERTAGAAADLAGDFQIDLTATRVLEAQATLATTFDSECMAGRIVEPNEPYPIYWQDIAEWDQWPFGVWEKRGLLMASVFEGYFNGGKIVEGAAGIAADAEITANGGYLTEGSADLDTTFDFEPGIGKLTGGAGLVISDVSMTTAAVVTLGAVAALDTDFQIEVTPTLVFDESVSMVADFAVAAVPKRFIGFTEDLATTATTSVIGSYIHGGAANLVCDSIQLTVGTIFKVDEYRTIRVLPESRVWSMVRETRTGQVTAESRAWLVEGYEI